MDEWLDEWTNGWTDGWMYGRIAVWTDAVLDRVIVSAGFVAD